MNARRLSLLVLLLGACKESGPPAPPPLAPWMAPPDESFRATRPAAAAPRPFVTPDAQSFTLSNGVQVLLVERHLLPMLTWQVQYVGGSASDPPGKEGRAELCSWLMLQQPDDSTNQLADMGSAVSEQWNVESVWLNGFALSEKLEPTLDVWARNIQAPVSDGATLERLRTRTIGGLPQSLASPGAVAGRVLSVMSYGAGHPMSRKATAASYGAVTRDDCVQFLGEVVRPNGARLLVAGDITRAEVESKFAARMNTAAPPAGPPLVLPDATPDPAPLVFSDVPGATQTTIYVWSVGPARQAPDYFATSIMLEIFGGDPLSSRLGLDLREMMGSTYSVSGGISLWQRGGRLTIGVPVQNDKTGAAITAILTDAQHLREGEVTDQELARSRDGRVAALPARFETVSGTLSVFTDLLYFGLPLNYYQGFAAILGQVDKAAVSTAARQYLAADKLHFVVVGDGAVVRPQLDALGMPIKVVDAEGKALP
jgi:zinc protease